jgi:cation:H+ antiporter
VDLASVMQVVGGLVLLVAGGELLVRGASALAVDIGISPLVVGLTVVSVATSAPELAVTTSAVFTGESDLALGNIVGSNIANILLILGISAVVVPLAVRRQLVRIDVPFLIFFGLLLVVLAADGDIAALDGAILLAVWIGHTALSVWLSKRGQIPAEAFEEEPPDVSAPVALLLVVVGVALLVGGSNLLVTGAVAIAGALGISSLVIGLTVVAVGTSLPELVASLAAVRKGETDLAVGNAIGSCLANIGLVLGVPALAKPGGLPVPAAAFSVDLPLMVAASVALLPVVYTGGRIARREGLLFVGLYVAYTVYLVLDASGRDGEEGFSLVMVALVLPLVGATLLVLAGRERVQRVRQRRENGSPTAGSSGPH